MPVMVVGCLASDANVGLASPTYGLQAELAIPPRVGWAGKPNIWLMGLLGFISFSPTYIGYE
jgi:hypothetical protein